VELMSGRGNRNFWRKPAPVLFWPPKIPHDLTRVRDRSKSYGIRDGENSNGAGFLKILRLLLAIIHFTN
jgi:hypothetical protein